MIRPIGSMLDDFASQNSISFHMPGHKGVASFLGPGFLCYDITELPGSDNLYEPNGVIKESQDFYAKYLNAGSINYLVNGSSAGVISSILSLCDVNKVLFSRNIHVSAVSGIILSGIMPHFIYGDNSGFITENDIITAMDEYSPDALFLVYPDYRGDCFDLEKVCAEAHRRDILVVVDSAHGAGFSFSDRLPLDCGRAGADIWTISLHKTLASVNQSAVLCLSEDMTGRTDIKRYINLVQTTSPSYPILASIEYALAESSENGSAMYDELFRHISDFLSRLSINGYFSAKKNPMAFDNDFSRILIGCDNLSGFALSKMLAASNIYVEAADSDSVLLLTSIYNDESDFERFLDAVSKIKLSDDNKLYMEYCYSDDIVLSPRDAFFGHGTLVPLKEAPGRISCDSVGCYPPGIPVILPGCRISTEQAEYLLLMEDLGYDLFGLCEHKVRVLEE